MSDTPRHRIQTYMQIYTDMRHRQAYNSFTHTGHRTDPPLFPLPAYNRDRYTHRDTHTQI